MHVVQHGYDHLRGVTYLEKLLRDCSQKQREEIVSLVKKELNMRGGARDEDVSEDTGPVLIFDRQGGKEME
ncbi:hypothetical protein [Pajaroellobacter abortibovis]|uniref:Peptide deformylase n=1 Tax=Pajaroellobacter abortibovis TaxID=1882918 RepID=A0A1L6MY18_9BACT|nr:hypothetical protein [Pajaroellobacter abortibovis]APS00347.1 hypothetical protein BCY86_06390 [Pajaroellobacter abortibovis]